jgi:branched-chain amino acid transport system ATP-binding protein
LAVVPFNESPLKFSARAGKTHRCSHGPEILLADEPSIGLEPRFIDMVFETLDDLQHGEGKTIIMVEQNAKKGLEFADIGYVLVSGQLAKAGPGDELLEDPDVGRLFLGG